MSVLVLIVQIETRQGDENISNLRRLFSDPFFIVRVCSMRETYNPDNERQIMRKALEHSIKSEYKDLPCLIVKDSSISTISAVDMKERVKLSLDKASGADLFFLCVWNDKCDKQSLVHSDNRGKIKWSKQPTATQAVMYRPRAQTIINRALSSSEVNLSQLLNKYINEGKLTAVIFSPNIIHFDQDLSTSHRDYAKLNQCAPVQTGIVVANDQQYSVAWILVISVLLIIIVLVAYFLMAK